MSDFKVGLTISGAESVLAKLEKLADKSAVSRIVAQNGAEMQQEAMKEVKVDTGTLQRSIRLDLKDEGMTAEVSANTEYAAYLEYGTRFMAARPYLRPALNKQAEKFKKDLENFASGKE